MAWSEAKGMAVGVLPDVVTTLPGPERFSGPFATLLTPAPRARGTCRTVTSLGHGTLCCHDCSLCHCEGYVA